MTLQQSARNSENNWHPRLPTNYIHLVEYLQCRAVTLYPTIQSSNDGDGRVSQEHGLSSESHSLCSLHRVITADQTHCPTITKKLLHNCRHNPLTSHDFAFESIPRKAKISHAESRHSATLKNTKMCRPN